METSLGLYNFIVSLHITDSLDFHITSSYFTAFFSTVLVSNFWKFTKPFWYLPGIQILFFIYAIIADRKKVEIKKRYNRYFMLKIYEVFKSEEEVFK